MGDKIPWEIQGAKYMYLFDQAGIGRWIRAEGKQCDIREKEIEEKVEADSPERRRGLPGRE